MIYGDKPPRIPSSATDSYERHGTGLWVPKPGVRFEKTERGTDVLVRRMAVSAAEDMYDVALDQLVLDEAVEAFSRQLATSDAWKGLLAHVFECMRDEEASEGLSVESDRSTVLPWCPDGKQFGVFVRKSSRISLYDGKKEEAEITAHLRVASAVASDVAPSEGFVELAGDAATQAYDDFWAAWQAFMSTCEVSGLDLRITEDGTPGL